MLVNSPKIATSPTGHSFFRGQIIGMTKFEQDIFVSVFMLTKVMTYNLLGLGRVALTVSLSHSLKFLET